MTEFALRKFDNPLLRYNRRKGGYPHIRYYSSADPYIVSSLDDNEVTAKPNAHLLVQPPSSPSGGVVWWGGVVNPADPVVSFGILANRVMSATTTLQDAQEGLCLGWGGMITPPFSVLFCRVEKLLARS